MTKVFISLFQEFYIKTNSLNIFVGYTEFYSFNRVYMPSVTTFETIYFFPLLHKENPDMSAE